jgi:hypothetical protein
LRKKVRGLSARSVRFNCPILGAEVRPGRRIVIRHPVFVTGYAYDGSEHSVAWKVETKATISSVRPDYSFAAIVDAGQIEDHAEDNPIGSDGEELSSEQVNDRRFRKRQSHIRIVRFLDEPDRKICEVGNILLPSGGCERSSKNDECRCAQNRRVMAECGLIEGGTV